MPLYLLALLPLVSIVWMLLQARPRVSLRMQAISTFIAQADQPLLHPVPLAGIELQQRVWQLSPSVYSRYAVA
ncbi:hypothetical protein ACW9KT_08630 [Hymenobacter sp. HD11105]